MMIYCNNIVITFPNNSQNWLCDVFFAHGEKRRRKKHNYKPT